jgi:His-Xaa-Ser system radical SAM maturase HxsB
MSETNPNKMRVYPLSTGRVALFSPSGDHAVIDAPELAAVSAGDAAIRALHPATIAQLYAKHVIVDPSQEGMRRLLVARRSARRETIQCGVSLHIIVPTLQCAHSCQYCQVSRTLDSSSHALTPEEIDAASDACFESASQTLTIEFQGGDPLIRFDLVRRAIERIAHRNRSEKRRIRYVVASTLHQLDAEMCAFFRDHDVHLSTSIDGPAPLHNANRPLPTRDAHKRTLAGIELARRAIGSHAVAALMTTTRASLEMPEAIVDEYVRLGLNEIVFRPLAPYGFAKRNTRLSYPHEQFAAFHERGLERVLHWNRRGYALREGMAAMALNKLLSPFDSGYVDQQSPTGAGSAVLVYNYDGYVYPSDEARMLRETGDVSLRLGRIGTPLATLLQLPVIAALREESEGEAHASCRECPFNTFCGPDPIEGRACSGMRLTVEETDHCKRSKSLFGRMLDRIDRARSESDEFFLDVAYAWARGIDARTYEAN